MQTVAKPYSYRGEIGLWIHKDGQPRKTSPF
jgi:hypothetical protein